MSGIFRAHKKGCKTLKCLRFLLNCYLTQISQIDF